MNERRNCLPGAFHTFFRWVLLWKFHMVSNDGCCINKNTFASGVDCAKALPIGKKCKYGQWALSCVVARACSIRCHTDGNARFTTMSVHVKKNCAKRKNLVAHFLLTVREVLGAEGVDMVPGDLNGTAHTKLSALPTSGVKSQAIPT